MRQGQRRRQLRPAELLEAEGGWLRPAALGWLGLVLWLSLQPNLALPAAAPDASDLVAHATMHATTALLLLRAWPRRRRSMTALTLLLALALEAGQLWVPGRHFDWADLLANLAGAGLGLLLAAGLAARRARRRLQPG